MVRKEGDSVVGRFSGMSLGSQALCEAKCNRFGCARNSRAMMERYHFLPAGLVQTPLPHPCGCCPGADALSSTRPRSNLRRVARSSGDASAPDGQVHLPARTSNGTLWTAGAASGNGVNYQMQSTGNHTAGFSSETTVSVVQGNQTLLVPSQDTPWKFTVPTSPEKKKFHRVQGTLIGN